MAQLPKINKMRFGIIDEVYMNTLANAVEEFKNMKPALDVLVSKALKMKSDPFLAQITGVAEFTSIDMSIGDQIIEAPVVWKYTWSKVEVSNFEEDPQDAGIGGEFSIVDTVPSITTEDIKEAIGDEESGYAFNLAELGNGLTYEEDGTVNGVNVSSAIYPAGFLPMSIPKFCYVSLTKYMSQDTQVFYLFDRQGTHDGSCD